MSNSAQNPSHTEAIVKATHLFSNEAFSVAKSFIAGEAVEPLKLKASELKTQVPDFAARMQEADPAYRPSLNRVLSEARLDLGYVLADGKGPSSIRLSHVIRESESLS